MQYTHKGFILYDLMTSLMPNLTKGNNVYRPSQGTYGAASAALQHLPVPGDNPNKDGADLNDDLIEDTTETLPPPSSETSPTRVSLPSLLTQAPTAASLVTSSTSTPTSASSSKRKKSALSAMQTSSASKKQRTNVGATAIDGIKESLDNFNSTVAKSILVQPERIRPDTSPERRERAVQLLERQEIYLTDDQLVAFFDYFKTDTAAADIYLAITCESLRQVWVKRQLWKVLGFPEELP